MMTRKDFVAIAKIVNGGLRDPEIWDDYIVGWYQAVNCLAREMSCYFATRNPNFDPRRFITACFKEKNDEEDSINR